MFCICVHSVNVLVFHDLSFLLLGLQRDPRPACDTKWQHSNGDALPSRGVVTAAVEDFSPGRCNDLVDWFS